MKSRSGRIQGGDLAVSGYAPARESGPETVDELEQEALGRAWRTRFAAGLFALGCACIAVSMLGFRVRWGVWPEALSELAIGLTLLAPIALPMALGDLLGLRTGLAPSVAIPAIVGFWGVIAALVAWAARKQSVTACVLLALVLLLASIHWHSMAVAMLGI